MHSPAPVIHAVLALAFLLPTASSKCLGAEDILPPPAVGQLQETNSQELLQTYLQLRDQIHTTQLAIEQSRQETRQAAAQTAEALSEALQTIQETFSTQRALELEAVRSSNKVVLIVVTVLAAMGCLSMLMMSYFQWRTSKGLARVSATLPTALGLDPASAPAALALANHPELPLFGAIEPPENQTHALEQRSHLTLPRHNGTNMSIGSRLFSEPGALVRRRRFRAVSMAVIVGLICAAGLAVLLYMVASRKLGFD
jgi:hypothetical protein